MNEIYVAQTETPIALSSGARVWLEICWSGLLITAINFTTQENPDTTGCLPGEWLDPFERYWERPLEEATRSALQGLPLDLGGTAYQQRVWSALQQIPLGQTASYGAISDQLKSSPRAVAAACRANPVVLAVPCHRVVSKGGLGGFMGSMAGDPIAIKQWLLAHEQ